MTLPQLTWARLQNTLLSWGTPQVRFLPLQWLGDVGFKPQGKPGVLRIIRVSSSVHRFQSEQKTGMCDRNQTQNPDNESIVIPRLQGATIYVEVSTIEDMTFCR